MNGTSREAWRFDRRQVIEPFREFLPRAPRMFGWWMLAGVPTVFIGAFLLGQRSLLESLQITIALIPIGIPMLGFLWIHPLMRQTTPSVRRFLFVCLWFVVTMIPAIALVRVADALVGGQLT
jgi:hypothetical protein